jgi:hypothetical protein
MKSILGNKLKCSAVFTGIVLAPHRHGQLSMKEQNALLSAQSIALETSERSRWQHSDGFALKT